MTLIGWTWNIYFESYPWTNGGESLKAWHTREEAEADVYQEWGIDCDPNLISIILVTDPDPLEPSSQESQSS